MSETKPSVNDPKSLLYHLKNPVDSDEFSGLNNRRVMFNPEGEVPEAQPAERPAAAANAPLEANTLRTPEGRMGRVVYLVRSVIKENHNGLTRAQLYRKVQERVAEINNPKATRAEIDAALTQPEFSGFVLREDGLSWWQRFRRKRDLAAPSTSPDETRSDGASAAASQVDAEQFPGTEGKADGVTATTAAVEQQSRQLSKKDMDALVRLTRSTMDDEQFARKGYDFVKAAIRARAKEQGLPDLTDDQINAAYGEQVVVLPPKQEEKVFTDDELAQLLEEKLHSPEQSAEAILAALHRAERAVLTLGIRFLQDPVIHKRLARLAAGLGTMGATLVLAATSPDAVIAGAGVVGVIGATAAGAKAIERGRLQQFISRSAGILMRIPELAAGTVQITAKVVAGGADLARRGSHAASEGLSRAGDRSVEAAKQRDKEQRMARLAQLDKRIQQLRDKASKGRLGYGSARELEGILQERTQLQTLLGGYEEVRAIVELVGQVLDNVLSDGSVTTEEQVVVSDQLDYLIQTERDVIRGIAAAGSEQQGLSLELSVVRLVAAELRDLVPKRDDGKMDRESPQYKAYRKFIGKMGYLGKLISSGKQEEAKEYASRIMKIRQDDR